MRGAVVIVLGLLLGAVPVRAVTFSNWIAGYSVSNAAPGADPDGDGIANIMEFAIADCDPTRVDGAGVLASMVYGSRATNSVIPWRDVSVIERTSSLYPPQSGYWYLGLRYKPRAGAEGIWWRPQYAWNKSQLQMWIDGRAAFLEPVPDGTNGHVIRWMAGMFRAAFPPNAAWVRLLVTEAPTP